MIIPSFSNIILIFGIITFSIAMIGCFGSFFEALKYKRIFVDTPCAKISSSAHGYVKIKGKLKGFAEKPMISPLTQRPCCWYNYRIVQLPYSKNDSIEVIEKNTSKNLFRLVDDNGECIVCPANADVLTKTQGSWRTKGFDLTFIKAEPTLLKRLQGKLQNKKIYEFTENRLMPELEATVLGYLESYSPARNPFEENSIPYQEWETLKDTPQERVNLISGFNLEGRAYIISDQDMYVFARDCYKTIWLTGLFFFVSGIGVIMMFACLSGYSYGS